MKEKPKKRPVKGNVKHKKSEKRLITGNTEVMDFDLEEELRLRQEKRAAKKAARMAAREAAEAADETGRNLSDQAVKAQEAEITAAETAEAEIARVETAEAVYVSGELPDTPAETTVDADEAAAPAEEIPVKEETDKSEDIVETAEAAEAAEGSGTEKSAEMEAVPGAEKSAEMEAVPGAEKSAAAAEENLNQSWDTMPEKEVSIGEDTMELLGMDELLDELYADEDQDGEEDEHGSGAKSGGRADYMDFVPKKMTGGSEEMSSGRKAAAAAAVSNSGKATASNSRKAAASNPRKAEVANSRKAAAHHGTSRAASKNKRKKGGFLAGFDMMDRIIAATGVLVVLVAVLTAGIYTTAQSAKKQVAAMAEIGMKMETIGIAGEGIFTAVADARIAAQEAAEYVQEEAEVTEYEEKELTTEMNVGLKLTSVQRDLKIKFTNKSSGKLVGNQPFEVAIEGPENMTKVDDDEDGIIYISSIKPGEYTVTITAPEEIDGSRVKGVSSLVTVKDQIEYKKIDVADEVKTEAEVNASQEDTAVKVETESVSTDTVEWVESSKTAVGGSVSYVEVKKADIPDPANSASAGFMTIAAKKETAAEDSSLFLLKTESAADSLWISLRAAGQSRKLVLLSNTEPPETKPAAGKTKTELTVKSITISGSDSAAVGDSVTLNASVTMSDDSAGDAGKVSWSYDGQSSTGASVTVSAGEAKTITVTASLDGQSAQRTVTFTTAAPSESEPESEPEPEPEPDPAPAKVKSVSVSASNSAPQVGDKITFTATVTMEGDANYAGTITWSGAASGSGSSVEVTASAAGSLSVTATADGVSGKLDLTVSEKPVSVIKVSSVTLDQTALTLTAGDSKALTATVKPDDAADKTLQWSSSNTAVATVDNSGNVKAVAAGSADITVKSNDGGASAVCKVTVNAKAAALSVTLEAPGTMKSGEEKTLKWTTAGEVDTSKTVFSSSDKNLATVDNAGKVKALAKGSVTITVTVTGKDGKTATASGTLTINPAGSVTITLNPTSASLKKGEKLNISATVNTSGGKGLTWKSSDESLAKITSSSDTSCTVEALKAGTVTITATSKEKTDVSAVCSVKITADVDLTAKLKDSAGNQLYVKTGDTYREATVADYYEYDTFYRKQDNSQYLYTGWQNIDGKRYYFDKNGTPVTGDQIIQGMQYSFNSDGSLKVNGSFGIDVSKHNGSIDWNAVKNAGVDFVIIRCGYRGSATGVLVEDPKFKANVQGATAAGLKVGIYFFSQAVNEVEAVEEASMTLSLINKYKITYPVYIDVEAANGRADGMDAATRTKVIKAYCQTIRNSGYTAGIYANKTWLNSKFNVGELGSYKIWLAQYAATPTYNGRYEMWQYSSTGRISGISGNVDLNTSYMSY